MHDSEFTFLQLFKNIFGILKVIVSIVLSPFILSIHYSSLVIIHFKTKAALKIISRYIESGHSVISEIPRNTPLVVTMSSTLSSMSSTLISLVSIFQQNIKPDSLLLFLPDDEYDHLSNYTHSIALLKKLGVSIRWTQSHVGVYSRIIPAREQYPEAVIIAIDHTFAYTPLVLENFYNLHLQYPDDIISPTCHVLVKEHVLKLEPMDKIIQHTEKLIEESFIINTRSLNFFFRCSPIVLLPPQALHHAYNRDVYEELAPEHPDVWFNAMALLKGTKKYFFDFNTSLHCHPISARTLDIKLSDLFDNTSPRKDLQSIDLEMKRVFDYFEVYSKIQKY